MGEPKPVYPVMPTQVPDEPTPQKDIDFTLTDQELFLFDGWAVEHAAQIPGTLIDYWCIDGQGSTMDPLYREPTKRAFVGPFRLKGWVEYPQHAPSVREEGEITEWECTAWIPRKIFEDAKMPQPQLGDVLRIWKIPFYDTWSTESEIELNKVPGAAYYFDVVHQEEDGHLFDNASFVGYKFSLKRRGEFTPERRLDP